ncbi:phosphatidylserine decarboxylase [Cryptosporidium bovis]|uniref:phosphatidylserine decarboxylase n=1 Tax=Cryptosporidium bovis TaxID=310047 RepID=UPI00351A8763|nr:phosphatidylserine decarboxylase [Cryptosporidium bovis]
MFNLLKSKSLFFIGTTFVVYKYFENSFMNELLASGKREEYISDYKKIFLLKSLFGRTRSKCIGKLLNINIPILIRRRLYGFIINNYLAKNPEGKTPEGNICYFEKRFTKPLESYNSIGELFTRSMNPSEIKIYEIDDYKSVSSPCEGRIIEFGRIFSNKCIQLKSSTFLISELLQENFESLIKNSNLYYSIIYLSPKNYHRFHTPSKIKINLIRHVTGECFPVFKGIASRLNNLFSLNERIVINSNWKYGKMYIIAVAAHGVSDIKLFCIPKLKTNENNTKPNYLMDKTQEQVTREYTNFCDQENKGIYNKGEEIGLFSLGSTIIVIFQAPDTFKFTIKKGEDVQLGSPLGSV